MDYQELQIKYLEVDAIVNEYIDRNEIELLSDEFQEEYSQLRLQIIQAQSEINGIDYDFSNHQMNVNSAHIVNAAIVKLLYSYYNLIESLVILEEIAYLVEVKESLEDVIIDEFLSQNFDVNPLDLA